MRNMRQQNQKLRAVMAEKDIFDENTGHVLREINGELVEMKYCPRCEQWHPLGDFYAVKGGRDCLSTYCKKCNIENSSKNKQDTTVKFNTLMDENLPGDKFDAKPVEPVVEEANSIEQLLEALKTEVTKVQTQKKDLSNLTEKEVKEVLENNQVPPRILFEAIARQTNDRFTFFAYDKELGMTIPIKTKEETQAYVMGA